MHENTLSVRPSRSLNHTTAYASVFPGVCGLLLLEESGTVDLRNMTGRCTLSIGRPLDKVIHIKVESSSLSCKKS